MHVPIKKLICLCISILYSYTGEVTYSCEISNLESMKFSMMHFKSKIFKLQIMPDHCCSLYRAFEL